MWWLCSESSKKEDKPMLVLGSFLLMFHWLKQVTWPSPDSMWEAPIQGREHRQTCFTGAITIIVVYNVFRKKLGAIPTSFIH